MTSKIRKDAMSMVINASSVALSSEREYRSYQQKQSVSVVTRGSEGVSLDISDSSKSLVQQMKQYKEEENQRKASQEQQNAANFFKNSIADKQVKDREEGPVISEDSAELSLLRKLLEALKSMQRGDYGGAQKQLKEIRAEKRAISYGRFSLASSNSSRSVVNLSSEGVTSGTLWTKTTATSSFFSEMECTTFSATGLAKTADGREINFNVDLEMSRGFTAKYESLEQSSYILTDPLVINLDSNVGSVTDMKFLFDIDSDGKEEEISFAGQGSGFLALDKNKDGIINDGSELFGTKSGDGFKDLAQYDEDGNGWIDEADSIFKDLKVWTKDENGNNKLIDLLSADVGAIYLGNADTQYSLNDMLTNETKGVIRKTGVYLKESGGVGTVQHIDLAV